MKVLGQLRDQREGLGTGSDNDPWRNAAISDLLQYFDYRCRSFRAEAMRTNEMVEGLEVEYGPPLPRFLPCEEERGVEALPPWTFEAHHCTLGYQGLDLLKEPFPLDGVGLHWKGCLSDSGEL